MAKPDPTGYGAKTAKGERPYLYSDEHAAWRRNPESDQARRAWAIKFSRHERGRSHT